MFWPNSVRVQRYGFSDSITHDPKNSAMYCSSSVESPNRNCRALRLCSHETMKGRDFSRIVFIGASGTEGSLCQKSTIGGAVAGGSRHALGCGRKVLKSGSLYGESPR